MSDDYKPRMSFEITEEQQLRANRLLNTYGLRRTVFGVILDDLLDMIEEHGQIVVGILLERATKPREIMPSLAQAERKGK
jgi:hypothetical protein